MFLPLLQVKDKDRIVVHLYWKLNQDEPTVIFIESILAGQNAPSTSPVIDCVVDISPGFHRRQDIPVSGNEALKSQNETLVLIDFTLMKTKGDFIGKDMSRRLYAKNFHFRQSYFLRNDDLSKLFSGLFRFRGDHWSRQPSHAQLASAPPNARLYGRDVLYI